MEDAKIIELFQIRSEQAIGELAAKHGRALMKVAENILGNRSDAEECVNDTYLGVWNSIPHDEPQNLLSYACRITRNISVSRYRKNTAQKRRCQYDRALDELEDSLSTGDTVSDAISEDELAHAINDYLGRLDAETRVMFVRRYFYSDSVSDIAKRVGTNSRTVSQKLFRARERLRLYLEERELMK